LPRFFWPRLRPDKRPQYHNKVRLADAEVRVVAAVVADGATVKAQRRLPDAEPLQAGKPQPHRRRAASQ
jgi:hypothetical protein